MLFPDLEDGSTGHDFLRVENKIRSGRGELLSVHRVDRTGNDLNRGIPFPDGENCFEVRVTVPGHNERDLEQRQPREHVGGGDIAQVRVELLVAEMADAGLILVGHDYTLVLFCELKDDIVTVRPAPENAVFYRSRLLKRGFLRHVQKMSLADLLRDSAGNVNMRGRYSLSRSDDPYFKS